MSYKLPGITSVENSTPVHAELAPNFTWGEVTKNGTRLKGLTTEYVQNAIELAKELQRFRKYLGDKLGKKISITINSWYRDPVTNASVGGASRSQHLYAKAADILVYADGELVNSRTVQALARQFGWSGGIGLHPRFTHLDHGPKREFDYD